MIFLQICYVRGAGNAGWLGKLTHLWNAPSPQVTARAQAAAQPLPVHKEMNISFFRDGSDASGFRHWDSQTRVVWSRLGSAWLDLRRAALWARLRRSGSRICRCAVAGCAVGVRALLEPTGCLKQLRRAVLEHLHVPFGVSQATSPRGRFASSALAVKTNWWKR